MASSTVDVARCMSLTSEVVKGLAGRFPGIEQCPEDLQFNLCARLTTFQREIGRNLSPEMVALTAQELEQVRAQLMDRDWFTRMPILGQVIACIRVCRINAS